MAVLLYKAHWSDVQGASAMTDTKASALANVTTLAKCNRQAQIWLARVGTTSSDQINFNSKRLLRLRITILIGMVLNILLTKKQPKYLFF